MPSKIDSTLSQLLPGEALRLRDMIIDAIHEQPSHLSPDFNGPMAYELSVLNWDLCNDLTGHVHVYDEWWLTA
jgi:hypothetical protein